MIPKIIHYCWFGGNPLPPLAIKCIDSWKKYLPEYEIKEWNENNFDVEEYQFTKEALVCKKYAFVSDVCRLHALKIFGGVYMDTDVEVLKPLDIFLHHTAFSGFENESIVPTGIMASEKGGLWIKNLLTFYDNRPFLLENGEMNLISNTISITNMMKEKGYKMNNRFQEIEDYVAFYPNEYFCPKSYYTGEINLTENSYCIHHFAGSWVPLHEKVERKFWQFWNIPNQYILWRIVAKLKKIKHKIFH